MKSILLQSSLLLICLLESLTGENIKIVETPASNRNYYSSSTKELALRVPPSNISGPLHLQQLAGKCFVTEHKDYSYSICPFHNVTQKEVRQSWNRFEGVLGVWQEWLVENDTLTGQHFTMGEMCTSADREAKVMFKCSTVTKLSNITEPSTCHYSLVLNTPLACFEGAMQVYHLLSPKQLKKWDQHDEEYYNEEITYQGLTKRRREVLADAGLVLHPDMVASRIEKDKKERETKEAATTAPLWSFSKPSQCEDEKNKLQREVDSLKKQLNLMSKLIEEYPTVAERYRLLNSSLHTTNASTSNSSATNASATNSNTVDKSSQEAVVKVGVSDQKTGGSNASTTATPIPSENPQEVQQVLNVKVEDPLAMIEAEENLVRDNRDTDFDEELEL